MTSENRFGCLEEILAGLAPEGEINWFLVAMGPLEVTLLDFRCPEVLRRVVTVDLERAFLRLL